MEIRRIQSPFPSSWRRGPATAIAPNRVSYRVIGVEIESPEMGSGRTCAPRRLCGAVASLLLGVGWSTHAFADPLAEVRVRWEAPEECPDRVALDKELRRDLEGSQAPSVRLTVHAHVERLKPETWRVSITTESSDGKSERAITAHSCQALLDATSLIVAMLIDPETAAAHARSIDATTETTAVPGAPVVDTGAPPAPSNASAPPAPPPASSTPRNPIPRETNNPKQLIAPPVPPSSARSASRMPVSGFVGAWAAIDYGSLPGVTEAFGGSLGFVYGPWRGETLFGGWLSKSKVMDQPPYSNAGGDFGKLAGSARLCLTVWAPQRFGLAPCAGLELARMSGVGSQALTKTQRTTMISPEAGLLGTLSLTDIFALRFGMDVSFPLNRPTFGFGYQREQQTLFLPSRAILTATAGVEMHFGG